MLQEKLTYSFTFAFFPLAFLEAWPGPTIRRRLGYGPRFRSGLELELRFKNARWGTEAFAELEPIRKRLPAIQSKYLDAGRMFSASLFVTRAVRSARDRRTSRYYRKYWNRNFPW